MADQTLRPRPSDRCSCTPRGLCRCAGTTLDRCPCFGHLLQSDEPAGVERAALWELLKRAVRVYRAEIERINREWTEQSNRDARHIESAHHSWRYLNRVAGQWNKRYADAYRDMFNRTRERDEAYADLAEIRAKLAEVHDAARYDDITTVRAVEMLAEQRDVLLRLAEQWRSERNEARAEAKRWQKRAEMGDVHADLAKLEVERDDLVKLLNHWRTVAENRSRHIQQLVEQREKNNAELERLREDLAHARNQVHDNVMPKGQTATLRLENGTTVTGPLGFNWENLRTVNGWLVDVPGRSLVGVWDGGAS